MQYCSAMRSMPLPCPNPTPLQALSTLSGLRHLAFLDPARPQEALPPDLARGLDNVTALTCLTRLTELDFGSHWLPHDTCRQAAHRLFCTACCQCVISLWS